jgi:hypothetical protein
MSGLVESPEKTDYFYEHNFVSTLNLQSDCTAIENESQALFEIVFVGKKLEPFTHPIQIYARDFPIS